MQIHLFDCKSEESLRRGLGSNKLNLCMLVLSRLRETYWSASVIYRLFERAQAILGDSHVDVSGTAESQNAASERPAHPSSRQRGAETEHYRQQYDHQQGQYEHQLHQHKENNRDEEEAVSTVPIPELNDMTSEQAALSWLNESFSLSTVDHLLSPGFSISESAFPSLFMGYSDDMLGAYDNTVPLASEAPLNLLYHV